MYIVDYYDWHFLIELRLSRNHSEKCNHSHMPYFGFTKFYSEKFYLCVNIEYKLSSSKHPIEMRQFIMITMYTWNAHFFWQVFNPCAQFSSNLFSSNGFSSNPFRPILLG